MNPHEPVVGCGSGNDRRDTMMATPLIDREKPLHELRDGGMGGTNVATNLDIAVPWFAANDVDDLAGFGMPDLFQGVGKLVVENAMNPIDDLWIRGVQVGIVLEPPVDSGLTFDVREAFDLQVPLGRIV
jgi:hypothetical protein